MKGFRSVMHIHFQKFRDHRAFEWTTPYPLEITLEDLQMEEQDGRARQITKQEFYGAINKNRRMCSREKRRKNKDV